MFDLIITNLTAVEKTYLGLPQGGHVPAGSSETFIVTEHHLVGCEGIRPFDRIIADKEAGYITYEIRGRANSTHLNIFAKQVVVEYDDLTEADGSQTFDFTDAFPANAYALAGNLTVDTVFASPTVSAATVTIGNTASAALLLGATSILAAADTALLAAGLKKLATTLRVVVAFTDDDVTDATAGKLTVTVFYVVVN